MYDESPLLRQEEESRENLMEIQKYLLAHKGAIPTAPEYQEWLDL